MLFVETTGQGMAVTNGTKAANVSSQAKSSIPPKNRMLEIFVMSKYGGAEFSWRNVVFPCANTQVLRNPREIVGKVLLGLRNSRWWST